MLVAGSDGPPSVAREGDLCDKCSRTEPRLDEVPREYHEVLRAARALLGAGVGQEGTIYRTIVCAAWASKDPQFRRMRDAALEAGEGSGRWDHLCRRFELAFQGSIEPWRVEDGVLLFRRPPLNVMAVGPDEEGIFKEVLLEVYDRSVTIEDVNFYYRRCLSHFGLSHIAGRGVFAYHVTGDSLLMLTRPEQEGAFHPELRHFGQAQAEQGRFPDPSDVGHFYEMLRAKGYSKGRGGGSSPKLYNLIPACAAWYLGAREALATEDAKERNRLLVAARARIKGHLPTLLEKTASTLKRDVVAAKQELERLEADIRAGSPFLTRI